MKRYSQLVCGASCTSLINDTVSLLCLKPEQENQVWSLSKLFFYSVITRCSDFEHFWFNDLWPPPKKTFFALNKYEVLSSLFPFVYTNQSYTYTHTHTHTNTSTRFLLPLERNKKQTFIALEFQLHSLTSLGNVTL